MSSKKKVLFIAGMAYSGSSLLNSLLDTQNPNIRGIGESSQALRMLRPEIFSRIKHALPAGGPCWICKCQTRLCKLYSNWDGCNFYKFNFDYYKCNTLVDSSKLINYLEELSEFEPDYDYKVLILSKLPHAAIYSIIKHNKFSKDHVQTNDLYLYDFYTDAWINEYDRIFKDIEEMNIPFKNIHYDYLSANYASVIYDICNWAEEPFDKDKLANWQSPTTHILGGNLGTQMQVLGKDGISIDWDNYLDGKYQDKFGKIFKDAEWRNSKFLSRYKRVYDEYADKLDPILKKLGYPNSDEIRQSLSLHHRPGSLNLR